MSSRAGRPDLPARELARQIRALPAARYEIAVFDGRRRRRLWRGRQVLRSVAWLADRNRRGGHVYLRPASSACVLVDELTADTLAGMRGDGLAPAAVLETSPASFQAWFRLGREVGPRVAACAAQVLAARYGAGPGSGEAARLGRAAGFTNRSADLADADGRYPRVRIDEARGRVTPGADELVAEAEARFERREKKRAVRGRGKAGACGGSAQRAQAALAGELARIARRHGAATDWSRAFPAAARRLARAGYGQEEVAAALASCPRVRARRGERADDYALRAAAWAFGAVRRRPC